jgi:large subunit ribosomal protein L4e
MKIINIEGKEAGKRDLPKQFSEEIREDLIKRAVLSERANKRQKYGASPTAGKRSSAKLSRRRHNYRGSYGIGISRVPRKIITRRGTRMNWVGAFAPGTVGGRRAHPPKAEKNLEKSINRKELKKAIRSAISATMLSEKVKENGHILPNGYPFIIDPKFELLKKTKEVKKCLEILGLKRELYRSRVKKIRAGRGKLRGRLYKKRKGPLIVVSKECDLVRSARNIGGIDVVEVENLNAELLAPSTQPGRLTLWTASSIDKLEKEALFN